MNPLNKYPKVREVLYLVQWVTTGFAGALGVYFGFSEAGTPDWYTQAVAILAFAWTYMGITAQANVDAGDSGSVEP